jgi:hypothetical protein
VRKRVIEKILGWAPRTVYERHYLRIADHAMREAILTLYRGDPICPGRLDPRHRSESSTPGRRRHSPPT